MADREYRWGKFQGWTSVVVGLAIFLAGPFQGDLGVRIACYAVGPLLMGIGVGLIQKRRFGFVLFCVLGSFVIAGIFVTPAANFEAVPIILAWWVVPGIFYYPKRWKEMR